MDHLSRNPYYPLFPLFEEDLQIDTHDSEEERSDNKDLSSTRTHSLSIPKTSSEEMPITHTNYSNSPPATKSSYIVPATYPDRIPQPLTLQQQYSFEIVMKAFIKAKLTHDKTGKKVFHRRKNYYRKYNREYSSVIASHSIILVNRSNITPNGSPPYVFRFLVGKRRDSIERSDFIRGLYAYRDIFRILSLQTQEERDRSLNYTFEEQWLDYWPLSSTSYHSSHSKSIAQHAFDIIKPFLTSFYACLPPGNSETEWMFPRGRSVSSGGLDTAIREFEEETELSLSSAAKINIPPFQETYYGSDGRIYSTTYYIYETRERMEPKQKTLANIIRPTLVSNDFEKVAWLTLDELKKSPTSEAKLNAPRIAIVERIIKEFQNIPFMVIPIPRTYSLMLYASLDGDESHPQITPPSSPRSISAPPCYYA